MPREFSNLRAGVTLKDDPGNEFRQWPWIKLEPLDKILCSDIYLDFKVTLRELNSATKEAARQGVRPSEDPKAIKIYTRLRQIETAFKNMLEVAYPEGDQVLIKLRANSSHLTPATCHGKYTEKDGGKVTVWLFNHVGVEKQKRKIHYGHIYRVRKDDKGT